jgi:hypothetical protein
LGQPVREVRPESWEFLRPSFHRAFYEGESTSAERQFFASSRHGYVEECYFDYGISPIRGEEERIVGLFMPASESTHRVLARRRSFLLHALAKGTAGASSVEQACVLGTDILAAAPADVPFCMTYLLSENDRLAYLVAAAGFPPASPACPAIVPLSNTDVPERPWPFSTVLRTGRPQRLDDLARRLLAGARQKRDRVTPHGSLERQAAGFPGVRHQPTQTLRCTVRSLHHSGD